MADMDQAGMEDVTIDPMPEVGGDATEEAPFYEYGEGDSKLTFKTGDELRAHLDKSINFERDYTRKSQARESEYRQRMSEVEKAKQEFEKSRSEWEQNEKAKYDRYNEALSKRPAIAKEIERLVNNPITPNETFERAQQYADTKSQELEARLSKFEEWQQQQEMERQTEQYYKELEDEFPDFDRDTVKNALAELDGNDTKSLLSMLWKSSKYDPAAMREAVEQDIAKKAGAGMIQPGGGPPPKNTKGSTDPKQAHREALEAYGISK